MRPIARMLVVLTATMLPAVGALGPMPAAFAATITPTVFTDEPSTGDCTLRDAIRSADFDLQFDQCTPGDGADTIVLQPGTYFLTVEGDEDNAEAGDLDIFSNPLTIIGAGSGATFIDGEWPSDPDRIFQTRDGGNLTLTGLTIRDGDSRPASGGGMLTGTGTVVTATDAVFSNNAGFNGGGIQNSDDLHLSHTVVMDNTATNHGGGIDNNGGLMTLTDVAITGNRTENFDGGGIYSGRSVMTNVVISGNTASREGGGLELDTDNTLRNVTISGNSANESGGGIQYDGTNHVLNGVTIANNTADADANGSGQGGGINVYETDTNTLDNTIIARNTDRGGETPDCFVDPAEPFTSGGNNLIGTTTGCTFTPGPGDLFNVDPKLGPLADNGGFTMTQALLPGSPAIDAAGADAPPTDQRGLPRGPDIGAYELVLCKKVPINRIGTSGNDVLTGTAGADGFLAQDGNDTATGLGGSDAACMGGGKDTASGGGGKDTLLGEAGKDKLKGQGGKDVLKGGPGKDTCTGGGGKDKATCETEKKVP